MEFGRKIFGLPKLEAMTIVSHRELVCWCTLNEFESQSVGIWIYLFHEDMFSYQSSLSNNLNHSIRMSDGQVMAKIQSWSLFNRTEKLPEHSSTLNAFLSPNGLEFG